MTDKELIRLLIKNTEMTDDEFLRFCLHYKHRDISTVIDYIRCNFLWININKTFPNTLRAAMNTYIKQYPAPAQSVAW